MKKTVIAALLGATLLTGGAVDAVSQDGKAQEPSKRHMKHDRMLMDDANKDGVVTRAETLAAVDARFAKLDANKDGKVTAEERKAAREAMGRGFGRGKPGAERGDGPRMQRGPRAERVLTIEDERARALKRFELADRNGDGKVDQTERQQLRETLREFGGRGHHRGFGRHHGGDMPAPTPPSATPNGS